MNWKLQSKLVAFGLCVGALPVAVLGGFAVDRGDQTLRSMAAATESGLRRDADARLGALRDILRTAVEEYARSVESDMLLLAAAPQIATGLQGLSTAMHGAVAATGLDASRIEAMRAELGRYYTTEFGTEYSRQNAGARSPAGEWLAKLEPEGVVAQHTYVWRNPNPLGKKHLLDRLPDDDGAYATQHVVLHPWLRQLVERSGYYDVFLVDAGGTVVYTCFKELDFATSLRNGAHASTELATAVHAAMQAPRGTVIASDFHRYPASYEAPAAFAAAPVFVGDQRIGVVATQLPLDRITRVMSLKAGLGTTGEAYLVGADQLLRSDCAQDPDHRTVLASFRNPTAGRVATPATARAQRGESAVADYANYADKAVLGAFAPMTFLGQRWTICVEQALAEALATSNALQQLGAERQHTFVVVLLIGGSALAFAAVAASVLLARRLARPAATGAALLAQVANGDLRGRLQVTTADEIGAMGSSLNQALDRLGGTLSTAQNCVVQLDSAAGDLCQTSKALADGASQTAASLEEMRATITEIATTSDTCAQKAVAADALARETQQAVDRGKAQMQHMATAMQEAQTASNAVARIVTVINDVAFQTNLLALNAAVEAARAGDAGRGFAVVADEVRNLAQRSAAAARETAECIQRSIARVGASAEAAKAVDESFAAIQSASTSVGQLVGEVQQAVRSENEHISLVNGVVVKIDTMTQSNASAAEQLSAAVACSQEQAAALRGALAKFQIAAR